MAVKWHKTNFLGVRYREHATRKHGVRYDRCFSIRYKARDAEGRTKDKEEVVGWSSEGITAEIAFKRLSALRENLKTGDGAQSLGAIREEKLEQAAEAKKTKTAATRSAVTFSEFWTSDYLPMADTMKKATSMSTERMLYRKWIQPTLGDIALRRITPAMLEKIMFRMLKDNKSAASIRYALAVVSQVWTQALARDVIEGECPVRRVKKPRQDNRRMRFLSHEEAKKLLSALAERAPDMHDIALLSLYAGLRAGEINALTWADVDMDNGTVYIKDPKNKNNRHAYITAEIKAILERRYNKQAKTAFVFPARNEKQRIGVSDTFERIVRDLGFNHTGECNADGKPIEITDTRQRFVFHSLRHTFASWLVQNGTPIFTVSQLLGHADLKMTQRYSHLAPDTARQAVQTLEGILDEKPSVVIAFSRSKAE